MPGGVVVRVNNAELRTEWLTPEFGWSCSPDDARFFVRFDGEGVDTATAVAESLRKELRQHVFPAVRSKPMPHRPELDCGETDLPVPALTEPESSTRSTDRNRRVGGEARESTRPDGFRVADGAATDSCGGQSNLSGGGCLSAGDTSSRSRRDEKPAGGVTAPPAAAQKSSKRKKRGALSPSHDRAQALRAAHARVTAEEPPASKFWWKEGQFA